MTIMEQVNCPKCGATVNLSPGQEFYSCPYCKATSHVRDVAPLPFPMSPMTPPPAYPSRGSSNAGALVAVFVGVGLLAAVGAVIALGGAVAAFTVRSARRPPSPVVVTSPAVAPTAPQFQFTDRPLLFDVNGDGIKDVIGTCRQFVPVEDNWIGAYSGADGSALWTMPSDKQMAQWDARRAIAGDKLLIADSLGKLTAYSAATGKLAWTATLGEKPKNVCAGLDFAEIETADKQKHAFALADGAPRAASPKGACKSIWSSGTDDGPGYQLISWSEFRQFGLPDLNSIPGMDNHRALVPEDGRLRFMLGSKSPGSQVAMVAAVDGKKVVWKELVPGVDPLTTTVNVTTQIAALSQGKLVIPYTLSDHRSVRVACLDATTGAHVWDVDVPGVTNSVTHGVGIADNQVFYSTWTSVHVLSLANGTHRWSVGRD